MGSSRRCERAHDRWAQSCSTFDLCETPGNECNLECGKACDTCDEAPKNELVLYLAGASGVPQGTVPLLKEIASYGFHAIGIRYVNDYSCSVTDRRTRADDKTCREWRGTASRQLHEGATLDGDTRSTVASRPCIEAPSTERVSALAGPVGVRDEKIVRPHHEVVEAPAVGR